MSLAEVKSAIETMSDAEQIHLREFLQTKLVKNEEWRREISRRMREMDAGKKVTSAQLDALLQKLEDEGR
jgi:DNA-binding transcriptional MerR regulator